MRTAVSPLRQARQAQKKTLAEVAAAAHCDIGGLSRIERGERRASAETAARLAKALRHRVTEIQILYPERYTGSECEKPRRAHRRNANHA